MGVRLEDLKDKPQQTLAALSLWMGISNNESLYEMTVQGKRWWGDPSSPDYSTDGMDPFGKTSINRGVGSIFSDNDQLVLKTLFYPFMVRFGYIDEDVVQFRTDLEKIRPLFNCLFDFEKVLIKRSNINSSQLMNSGSYLYFRAGLIQRWNTLKDFETYPNMIRALKIN